MSARRDAGMTRSELVARILTAAIGLPIVGVAVWHGGATWAVLLAAASAIATDEYVRLVEPRVRGVRALAIAASATLPWIAVESGADALANVCLALLLVHALAWMLHLRGPDNAAAEHGVGSLLAGVLLPAGGLVALAVLRGRPEGLDWIVLLLAVTWSADTGAFAVGKACGRHRMCPRISPGKSWEGWLGGAAAAAVVGVGLRALGVGSLTWIDHVLVVLVAVLVGPLGDLCKSMVKRAHDVKDFGRILPGHGGVLDRIDALVFNAPCVLAWVQWLRP